MMSSEKSLDSGTRSLLQEARKALEDFTQRVNIPQDELLQFETFLKHPSLAACNQADVLRHKFKALKAQTQKVASNSPRTYVGFLDENTHSRIHLKYSYDHLFIMRQYKGTKSGPFRFSWRFGENGRIQLVDVFLINTKTSANIITLEDFQQKANIEWQESKALYHRFPDYALDINDKFRSVPEEERYKKVVLYGVGLAISLKDSAQRNSLLNPPMLKEGQRSLKEFVSDAQVLRLIEKIASLPLEIRIISQIRGGHLGDMRVYYC